MNAIRGRIGRCGPGQVASWAGAGHRPKCAAAIGLPDQGSVTIEPLELGRELADALAEKKGEDILLLDLKGVCTFADYFVLATGLSERTLQALADDLQRKFKGVGVGRRVPIEGSAASGWILLDFGSVIVHLLSPAQRTYYRLEELWHEGHVLLRIT